MTLDTLVLFIPACFALNLAFGPNNLLSVTIGATHGLSRAMLAAIGRLCAFTLMITVSALGLGALLAASETAFTVVKWLGAVYLVWLGIKMLRAKALPSLQRTDADSGRLRSLMRQEFLIALGNPKAILIFTAFFPQFVVSGEYLSSFATLGAIFLALEGVAVALYAYGGTRLSGAMRHARGLAWINRVSGGTMIAFGALLLAAKRPAA